MLHWSRFLPEAGLQIEIIARRIELKQGEIDTLKDKLRFKEAALRAEEGSLIQLVQKVWTAEEIAKAKQDAEDADLPF